MKYIVIDRETGLEITDKVSVIRESTDNCIYCRRMANDWLEKADKFHEEEIMSRYNLMLNSSMDDFRPEFDPDRGDKWAAYNNNLRDEIAQKSKEWRVMMDMAGDWEDREYAARFLPITNLIAAGSDNPLLQKECTLMGMKAYLEHMGVPNLGKYIA